MTEKKPRFSFMPGGDVLDVYTVFLTLAGLGILFVGFYAYSHRAGDPGFLAIMGGATIIAGAFVFTGGFIGFLFAIPRSRQVSSAPASRPGDGLDNPRRLSDYAANTNLEQISDWLTKILVGLGLVEFDKIAERAGRAASVLSPLLGSGPEARPLTIGLMTYFGLWGFFFVYLVTRLWLPKALTRAENQEEASKRELDRVGELNAVAADAYAALYAPQPDGFSRAIDLIEKYLRKADAIETSNLYLYLASAYGQRHDYIKKSGRTEGLEQAEHDTVGAVEKALALESETKPILQQLYRGTDENENDLVSLKGNERLDTLLGA